MLSHRLSSGSDAATSAQMQEQKVSAPEQEGAEEGACLYMYVCEVDLP
jgi:hypothetical protein